MGKTIKQEDFRPLIGDDTKIAPAKQVFKGFEVEKKFILLTPDGDYTKGGKGIVMYDEALRGGYRIAQGYLKDPQEAIKLVQELGITLEFAPNTIRLRKVGDDNFILTLKDKKATKTREVEWEIDKKIFNKYWKQTKGARVYKTRFEKNIKGFTFEIDAFTDRYLLMAECEVDNEESLAKVPKIGNDVTGQSNFSNKHLSK